MSRIAIDFQATTANTATVAQKVSQLFHECGYQIEATGITLQLAINSSLTEDFCYQAGRVVAKDESRLFEALRQLILQELLGEAGELHPLQIKERCLMIDIGRKFYPLAVLKRLVRSMALFGFTHLQLHFSDHEGFRIQSNVHPEIVSEAHLTQKEVQELIAYCHDFYIEVIPDLDSPGHLQQVLRHYPQWRLQRLEAGRLVADQGALDILQPAAVDFIFSIYQEYATLFKDSRYFHIGGDEFIDFDQVAQYPSLKAAAIAQFGPAASGIEIFTAYVNDLVAKISGLGFVVRVWNDGFYRLNRQEHLTLTKDCQISYWTRWNQHMAPVETFLAAGYQVVNHNDNYLYYVLGEMAGYQYPTYDKIQSGFQLNRFANDQVVSEDYLAQTPAVALAIWGDRPEAQTSDEVIDAVFYLQAAINEKVTGQLRQQACYEKLFAHWQQRSY